MTTHVVFLHFLISWRYTIEYKTFQSVMGGVAILPDDILQPPVHGVSQVLQEGEVVHLGGEPERLQTDELDPWKYTNFLSPLHS